MDWLIIVESQIDCWGGAVHFKSLIFGKIENVLHNFGLRNWGDFLPKLQVKTEVKSVYVNLY